MTNQPPNNARRDRPIRSLASFATAAALAWAATFGPGHATNQIRLLYVCLSTDSDIDAMAAELSQFGWVETTEDTPALTNGLMWIGASQYFTTDSGGETVETILALKEKTARALVQKKDIPQSKGRLLLRGDEVLHVMWRKPTPSITEVECHTALSARTMNTVRNASDAPETQFAFTQIPTLNLDGGTVDIVLLDAAKLAPHTPPDGILRTYLSTQTK